LQANCGSNQVTSFNAQSRKTAVCELDHLFPSPRIVSSIEVWVGRNEQRADPLLEEKREGGRCLASGPHEYIYATLHEVGSERGQPAVGPFVSAF